jgi:hypothetical protein
MIVIFRNFHLYLFEIVLDVGLSEFPWIHSRTKRNLLKESLPACLGLLWMFYKSLQPPPAANHPAQINCKRRPCVITPLLHTQSTDNQPEYHTHILTLHTTEFALFPYLNMYSPEVLLTFLRGLDTLVRWPEDWTWWSRFLWIVPEQRGRWSEGSRSDPKSGAGGGLSPPLSGRRDWRVR